MPSPRRKIAIVSTYDELCGIAGYTRSLERQLGQDADVTVFDLDQFLLRSKNRRTQRFGDAHVNEIAAQLSNFDAVNIQLEHGTLGRTPMQVLRRFRRLAEAAPVLAVTFHTVLYDDPVNWEAVGSKASRFKIHAASAIIGGAIRSKILSRSVHGVIRKLQDEKPIRVIVHTRRDMRYLSVTCGIRDVSHHPLTYVSRDEAAEIRANTSRANFPLLRDGNVIPKDAKLVGSFGFLSSYKGFETAIRALRHLPDDHHLLIFGGVHPENIRLRSEIDGYVEDLLSEIRVDSTVHDALTEGDNSKDKRGSNLRIEISGQGMAPEEIAASLRKVDPASLAKRVHFMGVLRDEEFLGAMSVCDAIVLPYMEVGQSSSGPASMALDMGCRVIASRTKAFLQLAKYHTGALEFFDIGNHFELASRIVAPPAGNPADRVLNHTVFSARELYMRATAPAGQ